MDKERLQRLEQNPRSGFIRAIREKDIPGCLVRTAEIHGHFCPGSAFGVMATLMGLAHLERIPAGQTHGRRDPADPAASDGMEDLMAGSMLKKNMALYEAQRTAA